MARAAGLRLAAAEELVSERHAGVFNAEAVYLAGYTVECALKALIADRAPPADWPRVWKYVTEGKQGHSFDLLVNQLKVRQWTVPKDLAKSLRAVNEWKTDMRYSTQRVITKDAKAFVAAARSIFEYLQNQLQG